MKPGRQRRLLARLKCLPGRSVLKELSYGRTSEKRVWLGPSKVVFSDGSKWPDGSRGKYVIPTSKGLPDMVKSDSTDYVKRNHSKDFKTF